MDANSIVAAGGIVLSLAFSYAPGLREWYDAQSPNDRRLVMGALLLVVATTVFGLGCAGIGVDPFQSPLVAMDPNAAARCTQAGAVDMIGQFLLALTLAAGANQATFLLTPKRDPQVVVSSQWGWAEAATHLGETTATGDVALEDTAPAAGGPVIGGEGDR